PVMEFENEASEKIFKALQAGKLADVYNYLDRSQKIDAYLAKELNDSSAADIVKLGMQLKYKDLTPAEIDYKFNKQFSLPSRPVQETEEAPEAYSQRLSAWEAQVQDKKMELMIEAKLARPELEGTKSKLVLPEIEQADEGYLQYKKMMEESAQA